MLHGMVPVQCPIPLLPRGPAQGLRARRFRANCGEM